MFSLSQLFPLEFQSFLETGQLRFATPLELFDRGFPGHYLRLIKRVRISIIALVPPTQGVRATLGASGISKVVIGPEPFQTIHVRRDPELIAFAAPDHATGVLELEPEGEMLLPFEGSGVDTYWELELPKAANPFDFRTIADVILTIEYTAFHNETYRKQVIEQFDPAISGERALSVRSGFPAEWYNLHNPDQVGEEEQMVVSFETSRGYFPPHTDRLRIKELLLYVVRADGPVFEVGPDIGLLFSEKRPDQDFASPVGGKSGQSIDGIISTRRANGGEWRAITAGERPLSPIGSWKLALPNTQEMRDRFKEKQIDDILLVITYEGRTPPWPT
jgi:hypothetical protein